MPLELHFWFFGTRLNPPLVGKMSGTCCEQNLPMFEPSWCGIYVGYLGFQQVDGKWTKLVVCIRPRSWTRTGRKHEKCNGRGAMGIHESAALQNKRNPNTKSTQTDLNRNAEPTFAHVRYTTLHGPFLSTGLVWLCCRIQNNAWAIRIPKYFHEISWKLTVRKIPMI